MRSSIAGSVAVLVAAHAGSAAAETREHAAVAAIDLGPKVPAYLRGKATTQIEEGLAAAGYDVVPAARVAAQLTGGLAACRDGGCVRAVAQALHVDAVVFADISSKDDSSLIAMRLYDAASAQKIAEVHEVCELCGESELVERLGVAASALRAQASEARARRTRLASLPAPSEPSLVPPIALGAAGVIAIGAGAYLLAIDGRGTCSAGDLPAYPSPGAVIRYPDPSNPSVFVCRDIYRTTGLGIVGLGVGVAALALGVTLVIRGRHHERAFELAPAPGGVAAKVSFTW